ncbi:MAG: nucleotide exchange factor GrpE [Actinobacteria bacterium]|nr:nucleotide exchange factor GrpE [Actinomycetota bacterium]
MTEDRRQKTEDREQKTEEAKEETITIKISEYEKLKNDLGEKETQLKDYLDTLQRLKAEFENYRKRILKEQSQFLETAAQDLIIKILPVLDNFELALFAAEETKDYQKLIRGIEMVYGEFKEILGKEGLEQIEAKDQVFNPEVHEAAMQVHSEEHNENEVVDVLRNGYLFKGKVLRPAMVKVARK